MTLEVGASLVCEVVHTDGALRDRLCLATLVTGCWAFVEV